jgi:hypothetical protein
MIEPGAEKSPDLSKCRLPSALKFDSRSEAALCVLFERYIPGWAPIMGVTFQIPIIDKRIDFLINNTLVEFHPIMINRELKSSNANSLFRQMYKRCDKFERGQLVDLLVDELSAQYSLRRWQLIQHSEHRGKQFVVCRNEVEIYKQVICRFSNKAPGLTQFKTEFNAEVSKARI